jgi:uncharacterized protein with FMN-binding domain
VSARTTAGGLLASGAILALSWSLGTAGGIAPQTVGATATGTSTGSTGTSSAGTSSGSTGGTTSTNAQTADGTYTGQSVSTRFGSVQVQVTVSGGQITDVTALHLTDRDRRSIDISNRAAPVLRQEVLSAQSTSVRMVSGATYTSEGYLTSLQSALDQAGL